MEELKYSETVNEQEEKDVESAEKMYKVVVGFDVTEDVRTEKTYHFKKPNVSSYDRYIKSMSKGPTKASRAFVMDNIEDKQKEQLISDLEQYPAMAITISDKLLSMLGMGDATLTKL